VRSIPLDVLHPGVSDVIRNAAADYTVQPQGRVLERGGASVSDRVPPVFVPALGGDADVAALHNKVPARGQVGAKPRWFFYRLAHGTPLAPQYSVDLDAEAHQALRHGLIYPRQSIVLLGPHPHVSGVPGLQYGQMPDWNLDDWILDSVWIQATQNEYDVLRGEAEYEPPAKPKDPDTAHLLSALAEFSADAENPDDMIASWSLWHRISQGASALVHSHHLHDILPGFSPAELSMALDALDFWVERTESDDVECVRQQVSIRRHAGYASPSSSDDVAGRECAEPASSAPR